MCRPPFLYSCSLLRRHRIDMSSTLAARVRLPLQACKVSKMCLRSTSANVRSRQGNRSTTKALPKSCADALVNSKRITKVSCSSAASSSHFRTPARNLSQKTRRRRPNFGTLRNLGSLISPVALMVLRGENSQTQITLRHRCVLKLPQRVFIGPSHFEKFSGSCAVLIGRGHARSLHAGAVQHAYNESRCSLNNS
jgi:hypothetical protein